MRSVISYFIPMRRAYGDWHKFQSTFPGAVTFKPCLLANERWSCLVTVPSRPTSVVDDHWRAGALRLCGSAPGCCSCAVGPPVYNATFTFTFVGLYNHLSQVHFYLFSHCRTT